MELGTPFGPGICSLLMYLHHSHHVSFERMSPVAHAAGKLSLRQIKARRTKFFVFMGERDVPPTNNISERDQIFRKVTNGFDQTEAIKSMPDTDP